MTDMAAVAGWNEAHVEERYSAREVLEQIDGSANGIERDEDLVFNFIRDACATVSFGVYLKQFIYTRYSLADYGSADQISERQYAQVILESFLRTGTPISGSKQAGSERDGAKQAQRTVKKWLCARTIKRDSVVLLAFGLQMNPQEVTDCLQRGIWQQGVDFGNPKEQFLISALNSELNYMEYQEALNAMQEDAAQEEIGFDQADAMVARSNRDAAAECFQTLLERAFQTVGQVYASDPVSVKGTVSAQITVADLEAMISCGIPVNADGNLVNAENCCLTKDFSRKRMTRQRLGKLAAGTASVGRDDLATLLFFIYSQELDTMTPAQRARRYQDELDVLLTQAGFASFSLENPYEAFLLMCLSMDCPLAAYADLWERSYQPQTKQGQKKQLLVCQSRLRQRRWEYVHAPHESAGCFAS